jgi:hypothetical protein
MCMARVRPRSPCIDEMWDNPFRNTLPSHTAKNSLTAAYAKCECSAMQRSKHSTYLTYSEERALIGVFSARRGGDEGSCDYKPVEIRRDCGVPPTGVAIPTDEKKRKRKKVSFLAKIPVSSGQLHRGRSAVRISSHGARLRRRQALPRVRAPHSFRQMPRRRHHNTAPGLHR